ncbi:MAG TPA: hypothetical protein VK752_05345 [Bryobacteraceae bacterium]|nr:hypothetical protein [Bryobacteraceae bacterium]
MSGGAVRATDGTLAIPVIGSATERTNVLEDEAKLCYSIYQHRVGWGTAWEHLLEHERVAWREVVQFLKDEPECGCGMALMCVDCDRAELRGLLAELPLGEDEPVSQARRCRHCGCTDDEPCEGGCGWAAEDLCTSCVDKVPVLCSVGEMNAYIAQLKAVAP